MSDEDQLMVIRGEGLVSPISDLTGHLESYLVHIGLPTVAIVAPIAERRIVIAQLAEALDVLPCSERSKADYLSRFTIAIAAGLFDGALNYLWNETVRALRRQVTNFDLAFFYSVAEKISSRYRGLTNPEDIADVSEHDLLEICRRIGLLNDVNHRRLEYVNYMRNHASAAHPGDAEIAGHEMMSWLSVCLKYAITAQPDHSLITTKLLLQNIRSSAIPQADFQAIGDDIAKQSQERIDDFLWTLFGLYTDERSAQHTRDNIEGIGPVVWLAATEDRKFEIGARFGSFRKNGQVTKKEACQRFLEVVGGLTYKDEDSLSGELIEKLENLHRAHFGTNNFYNEYPHARALEDSLPSTGKVPRAARAMWVKIISICYIGNGSGYREGVDEQALPIYARYVSNFTESETVEFIKLFADAEFITPFSRSKPDRRVREMATKLLARHTNVHVQRALNLIHGAPENTLQDLHKTSEFKRVVQILPTSK